VSEYIKIKDLFEFNPDIKEMDDDERIQMNHPNCPAGQDTKQRLFITKKGAKWLAYCHNCTNHGGMTGEQAYIRRGGQSLQIEGELHLPPDLTFEITEQPVEHVAWLHQYGIKPSVQSYYDIGWSEAWGRTILPVFDAEHKLLAYQRRRVLRGDQGPKYLTTRLEHIKNPVFRSSPKRNPTHRNGGVLVLTEDILSSIRVDQGGFDAWSLLGTYMTNNVVDEIAQAGYEKVVIWLDDDNLAVRRSQKVMRRKIKQVADVYVMRHGDLNARYGDKTDPKVFTPDEIHTAITRKLAQ